MSVLCVFDEWNPPNRIIPHALKRSLIRNVSPTTHLGSSAAIKASEKKKTNVAAEAEVESSYPNDDGHEWRHKSFLILNLQDKRNELWRLNM